LVEDRGGRRRSRGARREGSGPVPCHALGERQVWSHLCVLNHACAGYETTSVRGTRAEVWDQGGRRQSRGARRGRSQRRVSRSSEHVCSLGRNPRGCVPWGGEGGVPPLVCLPAHGGGRSRPRPRRLPRLWRCGGEPARLRGIAPPGEERGGSLPLGPPRAGLASADPARGSCRGRGASTPHKRRHVKTSGGEWQAQRVATQASCQ
jgi:hypothetical protein